MATQTLTRSVREEMFLGPTHSYSIESEVDDDTSRTERYTRTVEGWSRTVETLSPETGYCWRIDVWSARSRIGMVIDAVAGDRDMLNQVVTTELHFIPAHADRSRRRKALSAALAKHGLGVAA